MLCVSLQSDSVTAAATNTCLTVNAAAQHSIVQNWMFQMIHIVLRYCVRFQV